MNEPISRTPDSRTKEAATFERMHRRFIRGKVIRWIVIVLTAVVLAGGAIYLLNHVYNPFEESLSGRSLLVLTPTDADAVLFIPDVPEWVGRIRDRGFVTSLDKSRGFSQFLETDFARRTGVVQALSKTFHQLDVERAKKTLDLDLFGDVSGKEAVVSAWAPKGAAKSWQWLAVFRPESVKPIIGLNLLLDKDLGARFVDPELAKSGIKVSRTRDTATLTIPEAPPLTVARVRDAVIVGTDEERIVRLRTSVGRDGIPLIPEMRFGPLGADAGSREVRALVRRDVADAQTGLSTTLHNLWGPSNLSLARASVPRPAGEDLVFRIDVGDAFAASISGTEAVPSDTDLATAFRPFSKALLGSMFDRAAPLLPSSTFAFGAFDVDLERFVVNLFSRPELFSDGDRRTLADALKQVPEFGDVGGLARKLATLCEGSMTLGFFAQDRPVYDDAAVAGFAVVLPLSDEPGMSRLLDALERQVRESRGRNGIKDLVRQRVDGVEVGEVVLPDALVSDPRTLRLGFAIARGHLVVTNWYPSFIKLADRLNKVEKSAADSESLRTGLEGAPEDLRGGVVFDGKATEAYFDQNVAGWAYQQTSSSGAKQAQWRGQCMADAAARGLVPGSPEYGRFVEDCYDARAEGEVRVRRPQVRARLETWMGYFRGLTNHLGLWLGGGGGLASFDLRIVLRDTGP